LEISSTICFQIKNLLPKQTKTIHKYSRFSKDKKREDQLSTELKILVLI
jgi:hypothetical protein